MMEDSHFMFYQTGDSLMDLLMNENRSNSTVEYIAVLKQSKKTSVDNIYFIFNKLVLELRNRGTIHHIDQNIMNYSVTGILPKGHLNGGKKVIYKLSVNKKESVHKAGNLLDGIRSRDFTINSVCRLYNDGAWIDYVNGLGHKDIRVLRTINPPEQTFKNNPLGVLKALYLYISRKLVISADLQSYLSSVDYNYLFRGVNRIEIKKYLHLIQNENSELFRKTLYQFNNLTNYLYENKTVWT